MITLAIAILLVAAPFVALAEMVMAAPKWVED